MATTMTRRELGKSMATAALGVGLAPVVLASKTAAAMTGGSTSTATLAAAGRAAWSGVQVSTTPGPKSLALLERMKGSLGRTNYAGVYSIALGNGQGVYVEDLDGNRYIDCLAGASANVLGYGRQEVAQAYLEVASRMHHSCTAYSVNEHAVALAEKLNSLMPGDFAKKTLQGLSGSDSNDGAIEAMRKFTGRRGLVSFWYDYHGSTGLSQAASGYRSLNEGIYDAADPDFVKLSFPTTPQEADQTLQDLETVLASRKVGGLMVECLQGDGGNNIAPDGFYREMRKILDRYDVLLIADEVQSGMGRTGRWWSYLHDELQPDLMTCGKGLSGGYAPISALVGRRDVLDSMGPATHVFTYSGHGPSCAAALKVIEIIERDGVVDNAKRVGARLLHAFKKTQKRYPDVIVEARGRGLQLGVEINTTRSPLNGKFFAYRCVEKGVYPGYFGKGANVVRVHPPLILSESEADIIAAVFDSVAGEMQRNEIPADSIARATKYTLGW